MGAAAINDSGDTAPHTWARKMMTVHSTVMLLNDALIELGVSSG